MTEAIRTGLNMAYNMGRDDVISTGEYRADMFVLSWERDAYIKGWTQETHDLVTIVKAFLGEDYGCGYGSC